MASSGRTAAAGLDIGLCRDDDGQMSAYNGYAMLMESDCKLSASSSSDDSSSGDDDGTSSSYSSSDSSSDSGSNDVAHTGASKPQNIEGVPTASSVKPTPVEPLDHRDDSSSSNSSNSSSSGDDEGCSSGESSSGSSSDSGSSDIAQADASQSEDIDVEDVPTASSVKLPDSSIAAAAVARESQMGFWIQPNVVRPADLPSDHADEVHDWSGWPVFSPNKNADQKHAIVQSLAAKVPRIALVNKHEFRLPKMELLISTQGRFMQPAPSFRLTNLVDDLQYTAWLSFMDATGGECVGQYSHPDSPHPGSSWNGQLLSFSQLKLFTYDCFTTKPPPITLKCNNSYRIQVNVGIVDNSGHILSTSVVRQFVGAYYVAVTRFSIKPSLLRPSNKRFKSKAP